jgi:rhodanese-related sulfurtransferase
MFKRSYIVLATLLLILVMCNHAKSMNYYQENEKKAEKAVVNAEKFKIIEAREILGKIKKGEKLFIIDCRPEEEYNAEHIPGAVNVSMDSYAFKEDTAVKAAMEKIIKQAGKKIDFILIDTATSEEYMPKTKMKELIKYLPENRDKEVIFYCRKPT